MCLQINQIKVFLDHFDIFDIKINFKKEFKVLYVMDYINKSFSIAKTPVTNDNWNKKSDEERKEIIRNFLNKHKFQDFEVVSAQRDGQIIFKTEKSIPANERGIMLLDLEEKLKKEIDEGLTIWLEPVGDKSKLRNLRGIVIKGN